MRKVVLRPRADVKKSMQALAELLSEEAAGVDMAFKNEGILQLQTKRLKYHETVHLMVQVIGSDGFMLMALMISIVNRHSSHHLDARSMSE